MHFSDALPCRASDFPLSTKRIYIQMIVTFRGTKTPKIQTCGMARIGKLHLELHL